jgi:hypothetical protein
MVLAALLDRLAAARRAGTTFADAWPDALAAALLCVTDARERREWLRAIEQTAESWRDAYERRPPRRSHWSPHALSGLDGEMALAEPVP